MSEAGETPAPRLTQRVLARDRLEYWSLVAEIVAAVAVIVSLIFVGIQLRNANEIAVRDEANATMEQWASIRQSIYDDPSTAEIMVSGMADPKSLDEVETLRFQMILSEHSWATWQIWSRIQGGLIPETHWKDGAGRYLIQILCSPGGAYHWETVKLEMPPGFPEEVSSLSKAFSAKSGTDCTL